MNGLNDKLTAWARRHGIPAPAFSELYFIMHTPSLPDGAPLAGMSETAVQQRVRLAAPQLGSVLWRNNVGALVDSRGTPVRYGLANESPAENKKVKSSDLIGVTRYVVRPSDIGRTLGVFTAAEVKAGSWTFKATDHEKAQLNFHRIVQSFGGFAGFVNSPECLKRITERQQ